jgi:hypothetical protein
MNNASVVRVARMHGRERYGAARAMVAGLLS